MNKPIQLTEQDLHMLVEDAVKAYLVNEGIDEGLWGGLSALGSSAKNKMASVGQNMANAASNKWNQAKNAMGNAANAVGNKMNQAKQAVGQAYNNAKEVYQQGSARQDIQNVNRALQPMVQKGILGQQQYNTILGMLNKAIQAQGGQRMQGLA